MKSFGHLYNLKNLVLYQALLGLELTRLDIVDTGVRGYYTYYTLVMFCMSYFVFTNFYKTGFKKLPIVLLSMLIFLAVIAGNKAVIVYFVVMLTIYKINHTGLTWQVSFQILILIITLFIMYYLNYYSIGPTRRHCCC